MGWIGMMAALLVAPAAAQEEKVERLVKEAQKRVERGDLEGAFADLTRALELKPDSVPIRLSRAFVR